jgi:hypothetical protein
MPALIVLLLMQYVVSVKAGLVNHVQGTANVAEMEMARAARPIRTGIDGYVEVLLRPGSFLRLGENSEAILDDVDLTRVKLTLTRGPAVIEVIDISKDYPITVTTGNLTSKIVASGIYRFEDGVATVIQGKLQTADSKLTYEKGWQLFFKDNYRARKAPNVQVTSLDIYSQARSQEIAQANYALAMSVSGPGSYGIYNAWVYSPFYDLYTFIPLSRFRSPYGYFYYGVGDGRSNHRPSSYTGSTGTSNPGTSMPPAPRPDTGSNNNSGSGGASAPAPTASTPSGERTSPAVYIESKSSTVGATQ